MFGNAILLKRGEEWLSIATDTREGLIVIIIVPLLIIQSLLALSSIFQNNIAT